MSEADAFREGPTLESLLHRLAETPADFLGEPRQGKGGVIDVRAVVGDLLLALGVSSDASTAQFLAGVSATQDRNRLGVLLVVSWLLAEGWFEGARPPGEAVIALLRDDVSEIAGVLSSSKIIGDAERREEVARLVLARLHFRPAGETQAQAQDRLVALSSVERARVLKASQAAMRRAREIREALAKKAADESADKYTRE